MRKGKLKRAGGGRQRFSVECLECRCLLAAPEIEVLNSAATVVIPTGDTTPSMAEGTEYFTSTIGWTRRSSFKIHNTGSAVLNLTDPQRVRVVGSAAFFLMNNPPPAATVSPGSYLTFSVDFKPTTVGLHSAVVTIANDDPDEDPYTFTVQGIGVASPQPDLTYQKPSNWTDALILSTNTGDFTDDPINASQPVYASFPIYNDSSVTAGPSVTRILVDGVERLSRSVTSLPGMQAQYFYDLNIGTLSAGTHIIQIVADADGTQAEQNEYNNVYGRTITVSAAPATEIRVLGGSDIEIPSGDNSPSATDRTDYGSVVLSAAPLLYTYKVQNTGGSPLNLSGTPPVALSGSSAFVVSSQPVTTSLAAGAETAFQLSFDPTSVGTHTATVTIANDDTDENPYTFVIQGVGLPNPQPDLTFAQPAGWADKLVVSTNAGDNLDDSPAYSNQNLYVDCAVTNAGAAAAGGFVTRVLVDGAVRNTWPAASLAQGAQLTYLDFNLGALSAGTHTIQVVSDAGGNVAESNESNNNRTRIITVLAPPAPEMAVLGGPAVDVEIVDGDNSPGATDRTAFGNLSITAAPLVYTYKIRNTGTAALSLTGTPRVIIGGSTGFTVSAQPAAGSIAAGGETTFAIAFDPAVVGTHSAVVSIASSDSDENPYNFTITGNGLAATSPDLTLVQPAGWSDKVVISTNSGDNADDAVIYDDQNIYLDYSIGNTGSGSAGAFVTQLFVDGVLRNSWSSASLAAGASSSVQDYLLGRLAAGSHTIKFTADPANAVAESNEANNNRTRTITVLSRGLPDLNLALPAGWSDKLILSTNAGDNIDDAAAIYNDQDIYIDCAVANIGLGDAGASVTQLWVDGALHDTFATSAITKGTQQVLLDRNIGKLSAGTHTLQLRADGGGAIAESNEVNNNRTRVITILPRAAADLTFAIPAGWSDKMMISTNTGDTTDDSPLYNDQNLYIDMAIANAGTADAGGFVTGLYVDGVLKQSWTTATLARGTQRLILDFSLGKLSAGSHTLKITADSGGLISELNELNNNRTRVINVLAR